MSVAQLSKRDLILFDLDGTLVDSAADLYRSMNLSLDALSWPLVTEVQIREWVGKGASKLCESVLLHIFGKLDPEQHKVLLQKFIDIYSVELCVNTQIYHGVTEFLKHCKTLNIQMACVTNKPVQLAQGLLDALQLSPYFQVVLGGDSLPERKPHPLPLLHYMRKPSTHLNQS